MNWKLSCKSYSCLSLLFSLTNRSAGITDSGIYAIARGCLSLEMINIAYCNRISDHSFVSLSKCSKLNTIESRGCPLLTSSGLAAVAVGCKLLAKLDIKWCYNIDDAGMISLAQFSQNLRQVCCFFTITCVINRTQIPTSNQHFVFIVSTDKFVIHLSLGCGSLVPR